MEARICRLAALVVTVSLFTSLQNSFANENARGNLRTRNFVVTAPNQELASKIGFAAEKYRKELAKEWLGREIPDWPKPCIITANLKPQAFGETSFSFAGRPGTPSQPFDFVMQLNGSSERILDSVLPHEVSHTIFATHFGQPLPRWADEGACTTVEHLSERRKNHSMLIEFLTTGRGIPFNRMFAMKNYPRDILPLYAQGYSLCRYLIQRGGKRKFIQFMEAGMQNSNWTGAVSNHYQIKDLSELQVQWLTWVKKGCPRPNDQILVSTSPAKESGKEFYSPPSQSIQVASASSPIEQTPVDPKFVDPPNSMSPLSTERRSFEGASATMAEDNFYLREIQRSKSGTLLR